MYHHRNIIRASRKPGLLIIRPHVRRFQCSAPLNVAVGDRIPEGFELVEDSPGNRVELSRELARGRGLIVGVPAAFSPSCSAKHIPGYVSHAKLKDAGKAFVVSVNDPFVMKAWADTVDPGRKSSLRFLGDPSGAFTKALDLTFDAPAIFGHPRSKRYALVTEDGVVKEAYIEPDNTGVDVSSAAKVLG